MLASGTTSYREDYQRYREVMRQYMHARSRWWGLIGKPNEQLYSARDFLLDAPKLPFGDRFTIHINGKAISDVEPELARFDSLPWIIRFLHPYGRSYYQKNRALLCAYYMNELLRYREISAEQATPNLRVEALFAWSGFLEHRRRLSPFSRMRNGFKDFEVTMCADSNFEAHLIFQPKIGFFQKIIKVLEDFSTMLWNKVQDVKPRVSEASTQKLQRDIEVFNQGFINCAELYQQTRDDAHRSDNDKAIMKNNLRLGLKTMFNTRLAPYDDRRWDCAHEPTCIWLSNARGQFTRLYQQYIARLDDIDNGVVTSTAVIISSFASLSPEIATAASVTGTLSDSFNADKSRIDALAKRFAAQMVVAKTTTAAEAIYAEYLEEHKTLRNEVVLRYHPDCNAGNEEEAKVCFVELNHHLAVKKGNLFELLASGGQAAVKAQNFGFFGGYQSMSAWLDRLEKGFRKIEEEQRELWEEFRRYEERDNELKAQIRRRIAEIEEEIKRLPELKKKMDEELQEIQEERDKDFKMLAREVRQLYQEVGASDVEFCRIVMGYGLDPAKFDLDPVALSVIPSSGQRDIVPAARVQDAVRGGDERSNAVIDEEAESSTDAKRSTSMQL